MGDLIQTTGLINCVAKRYPDATIDLLVMKAFNPIANHMSNINEVISIDGEILNENLAADIWNSYAEIFKLISELNTTDYDILLNPIVSRQSALLAYLIKAKQKLGLQITKNKEQKMTCDFISYLLANQHKLGDHSFNLVDIFAGMVKDIKPHFSNDFLLPDYSDFHLNVTEDDINSIRLFLNKIKSANKTIIGFHIGASQSNKAWDMQYYHKLIKELLIDKKYFLVLFGGYKEQDFKSYFNDIEHTLFLNTIGDFKLNELIAAISSIDLLVTNDTGPMHIASAVNIPVIDISLGPVSKWETGAYNQNALIIEARLDCHPCSFSYNCQHWNCHHFITPETVMNAIEYMLADKNNNALYMNYFINNKSVKCYLSHKDLFGFQSFFPLLREDISKVEYIFALKRFIWSLFFTSKLDDYHNLYESFIKNLNQFYIIPDFSFQELKSFINELIHISNKIVYDLETINNEKKNLDKIKHTLLNVKRNKELLICKAKEFELIYDWFWFLTFKESEIEDENLGMIAVKTVDLYNNLKKKLTIFCDLLP